MAKKAVITGATLLHNPGRLSSARDGNNREFINPTSFREGSIKTNNYFSLPYFSPIFTSFSVSGNDGVRVQSSLNWSLEII